ncbi:protein kinase domain-containing protein [Streptomyces graminofaciens]|nr:PQQ-binding-like beta-propeller repeat protein [Streptomyces graminofaciens]
MDPYERTKMGEMMAQDPQGAPHKKEELPEIPGYRVDSLIGSGGMGHVYLGTSPSGRQVAIKVIRGNLVGQPDFRSRFRREVTASRQVSGAFTAPVLDADPDADPPWMATLYVPGKPLDKRVNEGPALTDEELYRLATGLAEALRDIHRVGIVHRDLKPGNVLLADDGPRVIDFGIVRAAVPDPNAMTGVGLTGTGVTVGTPPFMSPEQIRAQKDVGPRSDIFSLGSVLTYAASGHVPFDATDVYTMVYQLVHEPPNLKDLPEWLRPTVERCLAKEPDERPDAGELLGLLSASCPTILSALPFPAAPTAPMTPDSAAPDADTATAVPVSVPAPVPVPDVGSVSTDVGSVLAPPPRRLRRRRVLTVAATGVAVASLTGGLLYGMQTQNSATGSTGGGSSARTTPGTRTVTQPKGSASYLSSVSGSANFSFAYHDTPERRPDGWRPWQYNLQDSECVYAESSLLCAGEVTVRLDAATGKVLWKNKEAQAYGHNVPVVVGKMVLVNTGDRVLGMSLATGDIKWRYATQTPTENLMSDGERAYISGEGGVVFSLDARTGRNGWLEGAESDQYGGSGASELRVVGDRLYAFTTVDDEAGADNHVTVFDKDNGERLRDFALVAGCVPGTEALLEEDGKVQLYCSWMDPKQAPFADAILRQELKKGAKGIRTEAGAILGGGQMGAPQLSVTPGRVMYIGPTSTGGELVCVDAARQKELWRTKLPSLGFANIAPVQAGDRVYTVNTRGVAAFDAKTGKVLYRHSLPHIESQSDAEVSLAVEPLVAGGVIFTPSNKAGWMSLDTEADDEQS